MDTTFLQQYQRNLPLYRKLALNRLEQLIVAEGNNYCPADQFVDKAIRSLSDLPARPVTKEPYVGLYGSSQSSLADYREVATDRLLELLLDEKDLIPLDTEIDNWLREMSDLPSRPAEVRPYANLFTIRENYPPTPSEPSTPGIVTPSKSYVTTQQLIQIAGNNGMSERLRLFTPGVNETLAKYNITTKLRIAHFLAQIMHESGGFRWLREIWGPTDVQRRYEGRRDLGNTQPGDGKRYMGRGVIQLTGRANYAQATRELGKSFGVDFVANPVLAEQAPYAVLIAGWYWDSRNINGPADRDDLNRVTRLINGGTNGINDRRNYLQRAKLVLS
jgi:putative chitinase